MTTNTKTRRATAQDFITAATKEVTLKSGLTVLIRKVSLSGIVEITRTIPDVANLALDEAAKVKVGATLKDSGRQAKMVEEIVVAGVLDPPFSHNGTPSGTVRPADLDRDDLATLFNEILALSGFTKEAGEEVLPLSGTTGSSKR